MTSRAALLTVAALLLSACGQKNGLYMPDDAPQEVTLTPAGLAEAAAEAASRAAPAVTTTSESPAPADTPPRDDEDTRPKN